jgi:hypothetical protein
MGAQGLIPAPIPGAWVRVGLEAPPPARGRFLPRPPPGGPPQGAGSCRCGCGCGCSGGDGGCGGGGCRDGGGSCCGCCGCCCGGGGSCFGGGGGGVGRRRRRLLLEPLGGARGFPPAPAMGAQGLICHADGRPGPSRYPCPNPWGLARGQGGARGFAPRNGGVPPALRRGPAGGGLRAPPPAGARPREEGGGFNSPPSVGRVAPSCGGGGRG